MTASHLTAHIRALRVKCPTAGRVFKRNYRGQQTRGWVCSASIRRCWHHGTDSDHWFKWSRPHKTQALAKGGDRSCGDGLPHYNYFNLRAHNLNCRSAHRFANHHFRTGDKRFHSWRCHDHMVGEGGTSRCQRRHRGRFQKFKYAFGV